MVQVLKKQKDKNKFFKGIVHIHSTSNNTIITITNMRGDAVSWSSAGTLGFRGARKNTAFAAQIASERAALNAINSVNIKRVQILLKGQGSGRQTAIRAIAKAGLGISFIRDITPIPHNGCRPPKRRRV